MKMTEWDAIVFKFNHAGRTEFFSEAEYTATFGQRNTDALLSEYGTWKEICEMLREDGLDLAYPDVPEVVISEDTKNTITVLNNLGTPVDFRQMEHISKALQHCITEFYESHNFVPTIEQATKEYTGNFPDTRHYLETFGTWANACEGLDIPKEALPTFKDEMKHTVNYYNTKHGKQPGRLMLQKEWDLMVGKKEEGKNIPTSSHMAQYVKVDRHMSNGSMPKNAWEAIADVADLDCDKRGNAQTFERMHDKEQILRRYTNACLKSGHIMNLKDWNDFCKENGRSYRPPDSTLVKQLFGGIKGLKGIMEEKLSTSKKASMIFEETKMAKLQAAAGKAAEKVESIFDSIQSINPTWTDRQHEVGGRDIMQ